MANVIVTSDVNRIYFVFNDYSAQAGMISADYDKADISTALNIGDTDLFMFNSGLNLFRLTHSVYSGALLVDSVNGVAPTSNADLKTKIDAILAIQTIPDQTGNAGKYLKTDGSNTSWDTPTGGGATWGAITGTLSGQLDLQSALDAKQNTPTGTPDGTKYLRDDNTWQPVTGGSGLQQYQVRQLIRR